MIASINPANGETLRTFEPSDGTRNRRAAAAGSRLLSHVSPDFICRSRPMAGRGGPNPGSRTGQAGTDHDPRDGENDPQRARRGRQMRACLPLLRGARRTIPRRRARRCRAGKKPDPIPADRAGARRHALEFSVLAGLPVRGSGPDGGERGAAETRVERSAVRAGDRGYFSPRRLSGGRIPGSSHRIGAGTAGAGRPASGGGDADRQRARGLAGSRARRGGESRRRCWNSGAATPSW